ncbi:MAG: S-methyl-5-thioribose-1-phosphate isomerase [Acidilobaceae archaeon]
MKHLLSELKSLEKFLKIKPLYFDVESMEFVWLDTTLIPFKEVYRRTRDYRRVAEAIKSMEIRGAPAIGVAAAFGMALAAHEFRNIKDLLPFLENLDRARKHLESTRPTAVNLFWALSRVWETVKKRDNESPDKIADIVLEEAIKIYIEDIKTNIEIGRIGSSLIENNQTVLTHCNTGALATAGFGTALGVIRYAWYEGKNIKVITTETRPLLQGARLNAWELKKEGIPFKLIVDGAVAYMMSKKMADLVLVGADRIVLTGHTANKIGTFQVALAASYHKVPFYVVAPTTTIDKDLNPDEIVIEERSSEEVKKVMGTTYITLEDVEALNPSFDVTPPDLITGFVTERGIVNRPFEKNLLKVLKT